MSISLEKARQALENFNPSEFIDEIILKMPLNLYEDQEELEVIIALCVREKFQMLEAQYRSALKREMAKKEDEDCWEKI